MVFDINPKIIEHIRESRRKASTLQHAIENFEYDIRAEMFIQKYYPERFEEIARINAAVAVAKAKEESSSPLLFSEWIIRWCSKCAYIHTIKMNDSPIDQPMRWTFKAKNILTLLWVTFTNEHSVQADYVRLHSRARTHHNAFLTSLSLPPPTPPLQTSLTYHYTLHAVWITEE